MRNAHWLAICYAWAQKLRGEMRKFKIAIVERGKETLWRDYWTNSGSKGDCGRGPPLNWAGPKLWKQRPWMKQLMPFNVGTRIAP